MTSSLIKQAQRLGGAPPLRVQRYEQDVRQRMGQDGIFLGERGVWMEVQLKDTISAWKQHTTPDHFSHDAANRPDIN